MPCAHPSQEGTSGATASVHLVTTMTVQPSFPVTLLSLPASSAAPVPCLHGQDPPYLPGSAALLPPPGRLPGFPGQTAGAREAGAPEAGAREAWAKQASKPRREPCCESPRHVGWGTARSAVTSDGPGQQV